MVTIPKVIHYCWFGRNPLPESALKCISSWRKYFPDYEIKEWNEDNFDINICQYTQEAYEARKYAFVSDYARFWILYKYGGVYFDTDVEAIRPMDDIINEGAFMGIEKSLATQDPESPYEVGVAPGLGLGAPSGLDLYREILEHYHSKSYLNETQTIVGNTTWILKKHGFANKNKKQNVAGVIIYPADVFCPMDSTTGIIDITQNTRTIHHYSASWRDQSTSLFKLHLLKNKLIKILGPGIVMPIAAILRKFK
ncbi:MAG: glycosyl transferase [Muribaculum sp.]|nr:glycosyl transferase [Muribaculum sp.]